VTQTLLMQQIGDSRTPDHDRTKKLFMANTANMPDMPSTRVTTKLSPSGLAAFVHALGGWFSCATIRTESITNCMCDFSNVRRSLQLNVTGFRSRKSIGKQKTIPHPEVLLPISAPTTWRIWLKNNTFSSNFTFRLLHDSDMPEGEKIKKIIFILAAAGIEPASPHPGFSRTFQSLIG
jgi:hypothetical protein